MQNKKTKKQNSSITSPRVLFVRMKRDFELFQPEKYAREIRKKTNRICSSKNVRKLNSNLSFRCKSCECSECGIMKIKVANQPQCTQTYQQIVQDKRMRLRNLLKNIIVDLIEILRIKKAGISNYTIRLMKKITQHKGFSEKEKRCIQFFKKQYDVDIFQLQIDDNSRVSLKNLESPSVKRLRRRISIRYPTSMKQQFLQQPEQQLLQLIPQGSIQTQRSTMINNEQGYHPIQQLTYRTRSHKSIQEYVTNKQGSLPQLLPKRNRIVKSEFCRAKSNLKTNRNISPYISQTKNLTQSIIMNHINKK